MFMSFSGFHGKCGLICGALWLFSFSRQLNTWPDKDERKEGCKAKSENNGPGEWPPEFYVIAAKVEL
jgi:hypothetical protein